MDDCCSNRPCGLHDPIEEHRGMGLLRSLLIVVTGFVAGGTVYLFVYEPGRIVMKILGLVVVVGGVYLTSIVDE